MPRVLITGGPGAGKSTASERMGTKSGFPVLHTDDLNPLPWSEQSTVAMRWLDRPGSWIIEGCTAVRALRKWLKANNTGLPFDIVYWHAKSQEKLEEGAERLRKGCRTVWDEIQPELVKRGADIRVIY